MSDPFAKDDTTFVDVTASINDKANFDKVF